MSLETNSRLDEYLKYYDIYNISDDKLNFLIKLSEEYNDCCKDGRGRAEAEMSVSGEDE